MTVEVHVLLLRTKPSPKKSGFSNNKRHATDLLTPKLKN